MLKEPDHFSIPSPESLRRVGERCGLRVLDVWSGEYPLETPLGVLVAARALELMAQLNINLNARNGWPWQSGWKLLGPTG